MPPTAPSPGRFFSYSYAPPSFHKCFDKGHFNSLWLNLKVPPHLPPYSTHQQVPFNIHHFGIFIDGINQRFDMGSCLHIWLKYKTPLPPLHNTYPLPHPTTKHFYDLHFIFSLTNQGLTKICHAHLGRKKFVMPHP